MPATQTNQTSSKPFILTTVSHAGVSALDLAAVPHGVLVAIASAAVVVAADWGSGDIKAETDDAAAMLDGLSAAIRALDDLHQPVVPGREEIMNRGLTVREDVFGYPILRDGGFELVKAKDLTEVEKAAVRQHLAFNADASAQSADSFKARLAAFEREIGTATPASETHYAEAPAPDWRAV